LVATKPIDFRKGAESLAAFLVRATMQADPFSGADAAERRVRLHLEQRQRPRDPARKIFMEPGMAGVRRVGRPRC
jgi:hypothetical protein